MRSDIEGLASPHPLVQLLPSYLQEDTFLTRFTAGLDQVLAPVFSVLDCLDAYVDPLLAPPDFLEWVAEWVGAVLDDHWTDEQRRQAVAAGVALHRRRGTSSGLVELVRVATGADVVLEGHDEVVTSTSPSNVEAAEPPGLTVRIRVAPGQDVRLSAVDELVEQAKPAHLPHRIEVETR